MPSAYWGGSARVGSCGGATSGAGGGLVFAFELQSLNSDVIHVHVVW